MKREIKKRWVSALRSRKYKQGSGFLSNRNRFCCLGVLCNLHALETGNAWVRARGEPAEYLGCMHELPSEVVKWAGLVSVNPNAGKNSLAVYNDGDVDADVPKTGFRKIANLIQRHL